VTHMKFGKTKGQVFSNNLLYAIEQCTYQKMIQNTKQFSEDKVRKKPLF